MAGASVFEPRVAATSTPIVPAVFIALLLAITSATASAQKLPDFEDAEDPITQAITKCRQRLKDKPSDAPFAFPKTQYRLALLLESRLPSYGEDSDAARIEIAELYAASAQNETNGFEPSLRVEALTKGASLMVEVGDEKSKMAAEDMLQAAIKITGEGVDEPDPTLLPLAHASAVEQLVQLLLRRAYNDEESAQLLEKALDFCRKCSDLAPNEPVCDEYRGVVLRRMYRTRTGRQRGAFVKSPILRPFGSSYETELEKPQSSAGKDVHDAYESAAKKSHEAAILASLTPEALGMSRYPCGTVRFKYAQAIKFPAPFQLRQPSGDERVLLTSLWTRLLQHIVLAAAAAREAGLREEEDKHISYGLFLVSHHKISEFIRPDVQADFLSNAGIRHKARGERKEAIRYFRAALGANPNDGHALVQLASLGDENAASTTELSDDYVAGLFNGYSERFEKELVEDLGYRGHVIVADCIARHWVKDDNTDDVAVIDLGCGTGLLGGLLRQRSRPQNDATCTSSETRSRVIIQGIDLSDRMVEISREKTVIDASGQAISVYDSVQSIDASTYLQSQDSGSVDIITASDVFIYIGALDDMFRECSRVLKEGGLLGFTVEIPPSAAKTEVKGLMLLKSGRFGHSKTYVQKLANSVGLSMVEWKEEVLRKQGDYNVKGAVVALQRH